MQEPFGKLLGGRANSEREGGGFVPQVLIGEPETALQEKNQSDGRRE